MPPGREHEGNLVASPTPHNPKTTLIFHTIPQIRLAVFLYPLLMGYISTKFNERSFNEAYLENKTMLWVVFYQSEDKKLDHSRINNISLSY